jgi:hypothetical protein
MAELKNRNGFTSDQFPNLHINFLSEGIEVVVSLNIEERMVPHLVQARVFKSKKFTTYVLKTILTEVTSMAVKGCYEWLLNRAMIDCREAKQKSLQCEINKLRNETINDHNPVIIK